MTKNTYTTSGALVTIYWSQRGKHVRRKTRWGTKASRTWRGTKLDRSTWDIPKSVPAASIEEAIREILAPSDRAIVVFPFGSKKSGASSMSVWTFNCKA